MAAAGAVTVVPLCVTQLRCLTPPGRFAKQTEPQDGIWQLQVSFHDKPFITALVLSTEHPSVRTECPKLGPPKPAWPSLPVTHGCLRAAKQGGVVCFKDQSSFQCIASPCLHLISRQDALAQVSQPPAEVSRSYLCEAEAALASPAASADPPGVSDPLRPRPWDRVPAWP